MPVKKTTKKKVLVDEGPEEESPVVLNEGDYFTAMYGKVKMRGLVAQNSWADYLLANSTIGEQIDCEDDAAGHCFSREYVIGGDTLDDLEEKGVTSFQVVKDKRIIKIIDADVVPEIAGYRAYTSDGSVRFGCGAVEFTVEEVKTWHRVMSQLTKIKGWRTVLEMNQQIVEQEGIDTLIDINLDDVEKIFNRN